jgi:hypothetical protein
MTRPVYVIKLQSVRSDADNIHGLRAILKALLRRYGFRCVSAYEFLQQQGSPSDDSDKRRPEGGATT